MKSKSMGTPSGPVCRNTRMWEEEEEEVKHLPVPQGSEGTEGAT